MENAVTKFIVRFAKQRARASTSSNLPFRRHEQYQEWSLIPPQTQFNCDIFALQAALCMIFDFAQLHPLPMDLDLRVLPSAVDNVSIGLVPCQIACPVVSVIPIQTKGCRPDEIHKEHGVGLCRSVEIAAPNNGTSDN
jgi:hypothetical protein